LFQRLKPRKYSPNSEERQLHLRCLSKLNPSHFATNKKVNNRLEKINFNVKKNHAQTFAKRFFGPMFAISSLLCELNHNKSSVLIRLNKLTHNNEIDQDHPIYQRPTRQ